MKVVVNKCPHTGALFEDDSEYATHMRSMQRKIAEKARDQKIKDTWRDWISNEKKAIIHPDMIIPWIIDNLDRIKIAYNTGIRSKRMTGWSSDKVYDSDKFDKLEFVNLQYSNNVSNSHVEPEDGVGNWCGRNKDKPTGYPGWHGRIRGSFIREKKYNSCYPYSDLLNLVGLKTGSGGGGNESWGYDVSIFVLDWPGLKHEIDIIEQNMIVAKLKGVHWL